MDDDEQPELPPSDSTALDELKLHYDRQLYEHKSKIESLTKLVAKLQFDADTHNARYAEMVAELEAEVTATNTSAVSSSGCLKATPLQRSVGTNTTTPSAVPVAVASSECKTTSHHHQATVDSHRPVVSTQLVHNDQRTVPPRRAGQRVPRSEEDVVHGQPGSEPSDTAPSARGWFVSKFWGK